jgi:hypothetical protein
MNQTKLRTFSIIFEPIGKLEFFEKQTKKKMNFHTQKMPAKPQWRAQRPNWLNSPSAKSLLLCVSGEFGAEHSIRGLWNVQRAGKLD